MWRARREKESIGCGRRAKGRGWGAIGTRPGGTGWAENGNSLRARAWGWAGKLESMAQLAAGFVVVVVDFGCSRLEPDG